MLQHATAPDTTNTPDTSWPLLAAETARPTFQQDPSRMQCRLAFDGAPSAVDQLDHRRNEAGEIGRL